MKPTSFGAVRGVLIHIDGGQRAIQQRYGATVTLQAGGRIGQIASAVAGREVIVEGRLRRDTATGDPLEVDDVRALVVLRAKSPDSWRRAVGCIPARDAEDPPELRIRRTRDDDRANLTIAR